GAMAEGTEVRVRRGAIAAGPGDPLAPCGLGPGGLAGRQGSPELEQDFAQWLQQVPALAEIVRKDERCSELADGLVGPPRAQARPAEHQAGADVLLRDDALAAFPGMEPAGAEPGERRLGVADLVEQRRVFRGEI